MNAPSKPRVRAARIGLSPSESPAFRQATGDNLPIEFWRRLCDRFGWTERQCAVVELLLTDLPEKQIAVRLNCGIDNVKKLASAAARKMGVHGRVGVAAAFLKLQQQFWQSPE